MFWFAIYKNEIWFECSKTRFVYQQSPYLLTNHIYCIEFWLLWFSVKVTHQCSPQLCPVCEQLISCCSSSLATSSPNVSNQRDATCNLKTPVHINVHPAVLLGGGAIGGDSSSHNNIYICLGNLCSWSNTKLTGELDALPCWRHDMKHLPRY